MPEFSRRCFGLLLASAVLLILAGCEPPTLDDIRLQYTVQLNTWTPVVPAEPAMEEPPMDEGEDAMGEAEDAMDEGDDAMTEDDAMIEPTAPATTAVRFDVVVHFSGSDPLPGVTIDLTHASAAEVEKGIYQHYVDTTGILKGSPVQDTFTLEGIAFEDGDVFSASIRPVVPEAEKGKYREYSESGS